MKNLLLGAMKKNLKMSTIKSKFSKAISRGMNNNHGCLGRLLAVNNLMKEISQGF